MVDRLNPASENFILKDIINWLNPGSEDFFLKLAFIPEEGYFEDKNNHLKQIAEDTFPFVSQVQDTIESKLDIQESGEWEGVEADLSHYGAGEQEIISPAFVNKASQSLRYWISGMMWLLFGLYIFRRVARVLD